MLKRMRPRISWVVVRAGEKCFSIDINVVRPVIKDASHASTMLVIPISCRRLISMQWLIIY